jgi:hypothetical protein
VGVKLFNAKRYNVVPYRGSTYMCPHPLPEAGVRNSYLETNELYGEHVIYTGHV